METEATPASAATHAAEAPNEFQHTDGVFVDPAAVGDARPADRPTPLAAESTTDASPGPLAREETRPTDTSHRETPQPQTAQSETPQSESATSETPHESHDAAPSATEGVPAAKQTPVGGKPRTLGIDPALEARRARAEAQWLRVRGAHESGDTLAGVVTGTTNGGLLVEIGGIRGFLPASQTSVEAGAALDSLVKTSLPLKIIDVDDKRRRVVVSNRRALEAERQAKRGALQRALAIGQTHEGVVRRLADFGAFVDIGGIDGLVPMSELAFERVEKVSDILAVGDKLSVTVIRIEENGRKIALSRKNALPDPWRDHAEVVRPGAIVEGKVVSKEIGKDAGLRVELAPGIVGSIRDSDADPNDYEIGEAIEVVIRYADRRTRRIKLGTVLGNDIEVSSTGGFAPLGLELNKKSS